MRVLRHQLASRRAFCGDVRCAEIERLTEGVGSWMVNPTSIANSERIV